MSRWRSATTCSESFKAFTLLPTRSGIVHGHTIGTRQLNAHSGPNEGESWRWTKRLQEAELEADVPSATRHFADLLESQDNYQQTFGEYTFDFAPALFFDICLRLDSYRESRTGQPKVYARHPASR